MYNFSIPVCAQKNYARCLRNGNNLIASVTEGDAVMLHLFPVFNLINTCARALTHVYDDLFKSIQYRTTLYRTSLQSVMSDLIV